MCGRTAVIPLRITTLYAHDGDRWVPVFEHLSFGRTPDAASATDRCTASRSRRRCPALATSRTTLLEQSVGPVLVALEPRSHARGRSRAGPEAFLLGPDIDSGVARTGRARRPDPTAGPARRSRIGGSATSAAALGEGDDRVLGRQRRRGSARASRRRRRARFGCAARSCSREPRTTTVGARPGPRVRSRSPITMLANRVFGTALDVGEPREWRAAARDLRRRLVVGAQRFLRLRRRAPPAGSW